jgi:hypothetical protein
VGNQTTINLVVGVAVLGMVWYLAEDNTTLLILVAVGLGYLLFANHLVKV